MRTIEFVKNFGMLIPGYIASRKIPNGTFEEAVQKYIIRNVQKKMGVIKRYDIVYRIIRSYKDHFDSINKNLYFKLSNEDRRIMVRWFLKEYYNIDTATEEEKNRIDEAFDKVISLYQENNENFIKIPFRGKNIKYLKNCELRNGNTKEDRLMNYYDVAHAFFLTEYEKEGFNPGNGETILDCGAAYGDTLLLFRTLYPDSFIISFEAGDKTIKIAKENYLLNDIQNAVVEKAFLYSDSAEHIKNTDTWKIEDGLTGDKAEKIVTTSIDDYVEEHKVDNIGLIKFDIEGAEQEALKGAIRTIKTQKPLLYIPIYHLPSDIYKIPEFLASLNLPMKLTIKWTEKLVWGVDCVLFVRFV